MTSIDWLDRRPWRARVVAVACLVAVWWGATCGCKSGDSSSQAGRGGSADRPSVAFVTNGIASFWDIAEKGALAAGRDFDVRVEVRMPPSGVDDQQRMVRSLLANKIDGLAISPIDPGNQADLLDEAAQRTKLITHDSDAPDSDRLCYIGMDNYTAGRMCGELIKEALPDGGSVMIFVGRLGQANARLRRQGIIDELMDRSLDSSRYDDPSSGVIKNEKYTVIDTRTDGFDYNKAKSQAQDAIAAYPNLDCMVGLFAYNPPLILEAVRDANKLGKIKIVAFDEDAVTLQGIIDGEIYGTVVQNPYMYGYESVRVLAGLAREDASVLPEGGFLDIPARQIRGDNAQAFRDELQSMLDARPAATRGDESESGNGSRSEDVSDIQSGAGADATTAYATTSHAFAACVMSAQGVGVLQARGTA